MKSQFNMSESDIDKHFAELNIQRQEKISISQYVSLYISMLKLSFDRADIDKDQALNLDELSKMGHKNSGIDLVYYFLDYDKNLDFKIDFDEYVTGIGDRF